MKSIHQNLIGAFVAVLIGASSLSNQGFAISSSSSTPPPPSSGGSTTTTASNLHSPSAFKEALVKQNSGIPNFQNLLDAYLVKVKDNFQGVSIGEARPCSEGKGKDLSEADKKESKRKYAQCLMRNNKDFTKNWVRNARPGRLQCILALIVSPGNFSKDTFEKDKTTTGKTSSYGSLASGCLSESFWKEITQPSFDPAKVLY